MKVISNVSLWLITLIALLSVTGSGLCQTWGYTIDSSNRVTITGYSGPGGSVTIPQQIEGMTVAGISPGAFRFLTNITNMVLPETITDIGEEAFQSCTALQSVTLPSDKWLELLGDPAVGPFVVSQ